MLGLLSLLDGCRCPCGVAWNQGYLGSTFQLQATEIYPVTDGLFGPLISISLADSTPAGCTNLTQPFDQATADRLRIAASLSALEESTYSLSARLEFAQGTYQQVGPGFF